MGGVIHRAQMIGACGGDGGNDEAVKPPSTPNSSTAASTMPAAVSHHIQTLRRLDQEYELLLSREKDIEHYLHQLKQEEGTLRLALEQSSTSLKEQREKETKRKEDEAAARLEKALMMSFDDS